MSEGYQMKLLQKHDEIFDTSNGDDGSGVVDVGGHEVKCIKFETDENFRDDVGVQQKLVDSLVREMFG